MEFERVLEMGRLFDFYGKLLSEKQQLIVEMYYIDDFSLSEIGEEMKISRQAVYDTLKRAEKRLESHEKNLRLIEKFDNREEKFVEILNEVEKIKSLKEYNSSEDIKDSINKIQKIANDIIEGSQEVR